MTTLMLLPLALLVLAARGLQLHWRLSAWECAWHLRQGLVTVELRRDAHLARMGRDSMEFPQPREFRVLTTRLAGIPVWSQQEIVGLPAECEGWIARIPVTEFDHLFDSHFQLSWPQRRIQLTARAH